MLDLRELAALRAVADAGSIAAAARALGWSQPTVAHHLRALDTLVGAPTILSTARGTELTPAGALLLPHAVAILERADRALAESREARHERRGALSLGVIPSAGARLVPPVLRELRDRGYAVSVREQELDELLAGVEALRYDAAIVFAHPASPTRDRLPAHAHTRPLFTERLELVLPRAHPLVRGRTAPSLAAAADEEWIFGTSPDDPTDLALIEAAERHGFEPRVSVRSDDYEVIIGYVAAGFGLALVPETLVPHHRPELVALVLPDEPSLVRHIELVMSDYVDPALSETLIALLSARAAALLA